MISILSQVNWTRLLTQNDFQVIVIPMALAAVVAIVAILATQWRKAQELRLKEKMIDRGFSAEQIRAVISASGPGKQPVRDDWSTAT